MILKVTRLSRDRNFIEVIFARPEGVTVRCLQTTVFEVLQRSYSRDLVTTVCCGCRPQHILCHKWDNLVTIMMICKENGCLSA